MEFEQWFQQGCRFKVLIKIEFAFLLTQLEVFHVIVFSQVRGRTGCHAKNHKSLQILTQKHPNLLGSRQSQKMYLNFYNFSL